MTARAFIIGVAGTQLDLNERAFIGDAQPFGFILFKRNVQTPEQVRALVDNMRSVVGSDAPVLIDQEGGRVQRLGPPHWPAYPPAAVFGAIYQQDRALGLHATTLGARLIAADLARLGIDVDCLPVADVPISGSDPIIGDRAYGTEPRQVAALAQAAANGLLYGGVLPVLKHIPGHGRARADSHLELPVVDADRATLEASDFAAFEPLAGLPIAMTAHVVFSAIDAVAPATTSAIMVSEVIRGLIGFQGLLMSDDISMKALSGPVGERSRAAIAAGCDVVLHCNGDLAEMQAVAAALPLLAGEAARRAQTALALRKPMADFDEAAARREFAGLLGANAVGVMAS